MSRYVWRILYVGEGGLRTDRGIVVAATSNAALLQMRDRLVALKIPFSQDSVSIEKNCLTIDFDGVKHVWQAVKGITAPAPGERWNISVTA
jgi:hypothetical protein